MGLSWTDFFKGVGTGAAAILGGAAPGVGVGMGAARVLTGGAGGGTPPTLPVPQPGPGEGWFSGSQPWLDPGEWFGGNITPAPGGAVGGCPQIPVVVPPSVRPVAVAPPGYVIVNCNGQKVAMLKPVARSLGRWKPRKKPPIKVSDWSALMKSERVIKKLKTVEKRAGIVQRARGKR